MKTFKNNHSKAGQSATVVKQSQKHDANLQKNTTIYFQVGLILCLLGAYLLLEMQFLDSTPKLAQVDYQDESIEVTPPDFIIYKDPIVTPEPVKKKQTLSDVIKVVKDDIPFTETDIITPEEDPVVNEPVKVTDIKVVSEDKPVDEIAWINVEVVPVFPGCERKKTNDARRQCMSDKLTKLIQKKFNTDLAIEYGLSGKQKIDVQFKIDKTGNVVDIKTRAPHPALEKEAKRVINKIPEMKPGMQQNKPVGVIYQLPIKFYVQD
ncbi:energy transducer TonB [Ichthyenterobacterium sp. W332]|uniref:Energy transducer TonB n=1 Tax=Microcosmobacter mediterraneus TaxID=3075607 RepID=A0ABU2YHT7_9FLAO|nr:energy transducer TonB [Ichthyenterobacterium sp. W332]MDT0557718.1 energy transducer TonB [Ichthyenterobacterium sp. W332]